MKFFIKKAVGWVAYAVLTVLFFSLPIILRNSDGVNSDSPSAVGVVNQAGIIFEFVGGPAGHEITGDSALIKMVVVTDSSKKTASLYVNGEERDMIVVSDSMVIEFRRVYLKDGDNEIAAVLLSTGGDTLALRKTRIVSLKKL